MRGWHAVCEFLSTTFGGFSSGSCTKKTAGAGEVHHAVYIESFVPLSNVPKSTWYVTSVILLVIIKWVLKFTHPLGHD